MEFLGKGESNLLDESTQKLVKNNPRKIEEPPVKKKRKKKLTADEKFWLEFEKDTAKQEKNLKEGRLVKIDTIFYKVLTKYDNKTGIDEDNPYYGRPKTVREDKTKGESVGTFFYGKYLPDPIAGSYREDDLVMLEKMSHHMVGGKMVASEGLYETIPGELRSFFSDNPPYAIFKFREDKRNLHLSEDIINKRIDEKLK